MITRWLFLVSYLVLVLLWQPSTAKKSEPKITATKLEHEPINLFYFEESETILFQDETDNVHRSIDGGETWEVVDGEDGGMAKQVVALIQHPYDKNRAYALGANGKHWITTDQAKTWNTFEVDAVPSLLADLPLSFHGWNSKKVIFQGEQCAGFTCVERTFYTTDDFETVTPLRDSAYQCSWALGHPEFAQDLSIRKDIRNRILCIVPGLKTPFGGANRFVFSDDFFRSNPEGVEMKLQEGRPVTGVISTAAVKKFLVAAARSQGTDELALYVTDDTEVWHRAEFGSHRLEQGAYTLLESTNYSLQVDVLTTSRSSSMGVLFTSNSNGTYFTRNIEHTNRDVAGLVDFEKVADIQGIVLVNTVKNWEEVEEFGADKKKIVSKISFDDGRTFQRLKVGDDNLHLHSVTTLANVGRVFSTPAPGLVMGVGNTGDSLKSYSHGDLYVSDDAGVTWRHALDGPYKYEIGDQGAVVMAVGDDGRTSKIKFSIDHGKEWESAKLEEKIYPRILTTTPDSTSLKFLLLGTTKDSSDGEHIIYSIDFSGLHERKCKKDDFEKWPARLDENGDPDCLMGQKQFFKRRKANADCFVDEEFKDSPPIFEACKCSVEDFECDYNFVRSDDGNSCIPALPLTPPERKCRKPDGTYQGPSGWRLIPGDNCIRDGGENLDNEIERPCNDTSGTPATGPIGVTKQIIDASGIREYYYLERQASSSGDDETIIMRTTEQDLFITHDHGKNWEMPLEGEKIYELIPHPYYSDGAFFLTGSKKGFWTVDRGYTVKSFKAPRKRNIDHLPALAFHPQYKDWLIWTGAAECRGGDCHSEAHVSKNRGENWDLILRYVQKCEFASRENREDSDELVFCEQYANENKKNRLQLLSSDNLFGSSNVTFKEVIDFATMSEFIVVASRDSKNEKSMKASASVDGRTFAPIEFPVNLDVPDQKAYTVLDSSTHAVFLHVTVNNAAGAAYGSLIKSNSNGTSYVISLNAVNRNDAGYVDFEKTQGIEGVAIANVVDNVDQVDKKGAAKKLKTMITHNDGAQWTLLAPPEKGAGGKGFGCSAAGGKPTDTCSLHLHGYTERVDPRDTFASGSAIGLLMGVGNVGEYLTSKSDADTFMTRDGGITWNFVKKGRYIWEYGDSGSVIVIVPESEPTKTLYYSLNEGKTWTDFQFSHVDMYIEDISTVPSDTSKNFLLWGKEKGSSNQNKVATVNLDFSGMRQRSCNLDEDLNKKDDYYIWEPKHPLQENNCLFGHIEQYHRRKPWADCWNNWREPHVHSISENCTCTRADYEW